MFSGGQSIRKRRRTALATVFIILTTVLLILLGITTLIGIDSYHSGRMVQNELMASQEAVARRNFQEAGEHLANASEQLGIIKERIKYFAVLKPVPWLGRQVESVLVLVDDGKTALDVIGKLTEIGIDIESDLRAVGLVEGLASLNNYAELSPEARKEFILALNRAVPELEEARARFRQQRKDLEKLGSDGLFVGLKIARKEMLDQIETIDNTLEILVPILDVLPEMGGFSKQQNYLMFLQNTGELRPTGGFWGTYGVITIEDGEIVGITTDDIYAIDFPSEGIVEEEPPAPLKRYLGLDKWYLRDINWSPDVPTSLKKALELYEIETNLPEDRPVTAPKMQFDGAILVTPKVATTLLEIFGDVEVDGVLFTPENFFDVLEYEVEQAFVEKNTPTLERKGVIGDLVDELFTRMKQGDSETISKLMSSTIDLLENNDLMVYATNKDVQRVFSRQDWTGELKVNAQHDHFMVVDANLAALKTDRVITRAYSYSISKDIDGDLLARLQINYDHNGGFDYKTTRYRTYTRAYVPLGSELIRVEGSLIDDITKNPGGIAGEIYQGQEFGATVFGTFTSVEPNQSGNLTFVYKLPKRIKDQVEAGEYIIDIQRQPGVENAALNLDLDFDKKIKEATPAEVSEYWFDDTYTMTSRAKTSQTFKVEF